jgi:hypothetical protein
MRAKLLNPLRDRGHERPGRARPGRRGASEARPPRPAARATPPAPARCADPDVERARLAGGPVDEAVYTCACGYLFSAAVSTTVACPHCGTDQAW